MSPTLIDGRRVAPDSEEHRHECEARMVMTIATSAARREYLDAVQRCRGKDAADRLRATVAQMWEREKAEGKR